MRELQTTDSEREMDQKHSKEEDVVELSDEERPVFENGKLIGGNLAMRTRSAVKAAGGRMSTFTLEDNSVDSIIRDLEGMRSRIMEYELQMQQVGKMVGNPLQENQIAAV